MSSVVDRLSACLDERNENAVCKFNGYVEDYLNVIEDLEDKEELRNILERFYEMDEGCRIIVDLAINCNHEAIANQIIRYKDAGKIPQGFFKVPYLVYMNHDHTETGVIFDIGDEEVAMYIKGVYYVLSEPGNLYEELRNELISVGFNSHLMERQFKLIQTFIEGKGKAGHIQRLLDQLCFTSLDSMVEKARTVANKLCSEGVANLKNLEDPKDAIYDCIKKWYYLKKFVYVQTMMDKTRLNTIYEGNPKKQRADAKANADSISYVSFSECWKQSK